MVLGRQRFLGKHFFASGLLDRLGEVPDRLGEVRDRLPGRPDRPLAAQRQEGPSFPRRILDVVLDKYDEVVLLRLVDLIHFGRRPLTDAPDAPDAPDDIPSQSELVVKRERLAVRLMEPAALRVLPPGVVDATAAAAVPGRTPGGPHSAEILQGPPRSRRRLCRRASSSRAPSGRSRRR